MDETYELSHFYRVRLLLMNKKQICLHVAVTHPEWQRSHRHHWRPLIAAFESRVNWPRNGLGSTKQKIRCCMEHAYDATMHKATGLWRKLGNGKSLLRDLLGVVMTKQQSKYKIGRCEVTVCWFGFNPYRFLLLQCFCLRLQQQQPAL